MPAYFEGAEEEVKNKTSVFRTVDDFFRLDHISRTAKSVAVIGGGFLGTELACGLGNRGKSSGCKVVQLLMEEGHFGGLLPEEMSKHCIDLVTSEGVEVRPSCTVTGVQYDKKENKVVLQLGNDEKVLVDHVVVAVGIQPNVELAESAELEVDPIRGGFMVNTEMEARSNLYVAGDAACYYDPKLGRRRVEHVVQAVISGNIAGNNMTGKKDSYKKQAYWWTDLGPKFGCQGIGLVSSKLNTFTFPFPNDDQSEPPAGNYLNGGKGVVLYMKGKRIVGVLSWNMSSESHMAEAEKVIRERKEYDETSLAEVAVRFRTLEDTWNLKAKNSEETTKDTKNEQKSQEKK
ncbi:apoptosis-inducing factor 1, mitochondrial-like [Lingula anatina]|uniref:Apoptosis-inducing factor 1, mitochondrial-like n=1 Tax=Lingula anatina TaxID=7574 RepID=A0A1S3H9T8_LINAN|nr:apoptosis-inducing factor 1, mitochondrial-like [Lingula anatina]|eukprot:XP_013382231.1 apoptosis-inducing factor 1, mitochondrial-like [Lingula anatina]